MSQSQCPCRWFKIPAKSNVCGVTTLSITALSTMTLRGATLSIMTLRIKGMFATLSKLTLNVDDTQHNSTLIVLSVVFN